MVITARIQSPAKQEVSPEVKAEATKTITIPINFSVGGKVVTFEELETIVKSMGSYDNGYGAKDDKLPPPAAADAVPGVPGTGPAKKKEIGDDDEEQLRRQREDPEYQEDRDQARREADDEEFGGKDDYSPRGMSPSDSSKTKASKDSSEKKEGAFGDKYVKPMAKDKGDGSEVPKDTDDEPKKVEKKAEFALDFGLAGQVFKPTKAELEASKNTHFDKNAAFGVTKKGINTIGHQMTAWAISETSRLTPKKS